jgi:dihydroorotate dehydrogenase (NAD+) catalytic subunit
MIDLSVNFLGMAMKNPTVLASGILGVTKASIAYCVRNGAGAVTIKSISRESRKGHPLPIICADGESVFNAVGYSNPGWQEALNEYDDLSGVGAPVLGSVVAESAEEYAFLGENFVNRLNFDALEIPLSCPHTPGFGEMAGHSTPEATYEIATALKAVIKIPLIVKLSANVQNIGAVAKAAEDGGADAICAVNTMGPGVAFDVASGAKVLGFGRGGVSGSPLKPVAIKAVYDIYQFVKIPIIGTGGVATGRDAVDMIMAGATVVGLGTAVATRGIGVFAKIADEMKDIMEANGYSNLEDMRGLGHDK